MAKISRDQVVSALVEAVHEMLVRGEEVYVPELGTFRVAHCPGETEELPDGEIEMRPPRKEIVFTPHQ